MLLSFVVYCVLVPRCCVCVCCFWSKVRPTTFGCVAMGSVIFLRSRMLLYSARSGVNRVQVVLFGFSVKLFCFVQAITLCRYGCIYFWLHSCLCV